MYAFLCSHTSTPAPTGGVKLSHHRGFANTRFSYPNPHITVVDEENLFLNIAGHPSSANTVSLCSVGHGISVFFASLTKSRSLRGSSSILSMLSFSPAGIGRLILPTFFPYPTKTALEGATDY